MPTRGLLLGGGGFFAAYQAGAYEALPPVDCVAGVSAGALNAWAVAARMPAAQLQSMWLEAASAVRAGFRWPRRIGDGILEIARLESMVNQMVRDWPLRMPLGVVVCRGWRLRPVLVRDGAIDAGVLLASCAVPLLLPAQRFQNALCWDGGLRDVCPTWAIRELGATEIVSINVWTPLPWWYPRRRRAECAAAGEIRLDPSRPLGKLRHSALATPARTAAWIAQGRATALRHCATMEANG